MSNTLKEQAASKPIINFAIESDVATLIKEFKEENKPIFEEKLSLSHAITEFTMGNIVSLDSKIVKQSELSMLLKKWITNGTCKFKLLYRGSKDGF